MACICHGVQPTSNKAEGHFSTAGLLLFVIAAVAPDAVQVCPGMEVKISSCTCSGRCSIKEQQQQECNSQLGSGVAHTVHVPDAVHPGLQNVCCIVSFSFAAHGTSLAACWLTQDPSTFTTIPKR
jgi:hypothetical protein